MNTKSWNWLDKFISRRRLSAVAGFIEPGDVVLDLGCGVQYFLLTSAKARFKLGYGLDYDVKDSQEGNIRLINYKCRGSLPLESGFFDKIFLLAVLEHIEINDVRPLFAEFSRVLKKGGFLIITTPTPRAKPVLEFLALKIKVVTPEEVTDHKHYYIENEIESLAASSGLNMVKVKTFQFGLNGLYVLEKL